MRKILALLTAFIIGGISVASITASEPVLAALN